MIFLNLIFFVNKRNFNNFEEKVLCFWNKCDTVINCDNLNKSVISLKKYGILEKKSCNFGEESETIF